MTMPTQQGPPPRQMMGGGPSGPPPGQTGGQPDIMALLQQMGAGGQMGQPQSPTAMQGLTAEGANAGQLNPATEAIQNLIQRLIGQGGQQQQQLGGVPSGPQF
jgi:hypothetical protein